MEELQRIYGSGKKKQPGEELGSVVGTNETVIKAA